MSKPLLINIFGAAGTGKTILATTLANALKLKGINAEYCREWVKEPILNGLSTDSVNQWTITGEQTRLLGLYLNSGCDVVITDSPVLTGKFYGLSNKSVKPDMPWTHWDDHCNRFYKNHEEMVGEGNTLNIVLKHDPKVKYQSFGREQSRDESLTMQYAWGGLLRHNHKTFTEAYLGDFLGLGYDSPLNVLKALLRDSVGIDNHMKEVICGL
ncbi:hypothetical protein Aci011_059 [Acinetobacter phage vB_AbaM_B09_Aci01-1]|uniref:NadR/Ttd14 AAA domain-containing protein n=1 Tax=Acinetobacter phage vB_AbaM_B09_Aci01-1 TaxID=2315466 RepID=A0A386KM67_9CAUD|nr:hypothetical protein HOU29_gp122 [Acinetobacter phage vB_AbaM_B09_Aci01-1]AYD85563.1 hypothetical protein Aci011_059 [Acinetobacter phage vB_AbaM_B09_Aci01-1]